MSAVVVFGISSYLGARVADRLAKGAHQIIGVSRRIEIADMLLGPIGKRVTLCHPDDVSRHISSEPFAVVNLAYTKDAPQLEIYRQNRRLARSIGEVAKGASRLLHVSTAAVFGYGLEKAQKPRRVRWRPSDTYTESKVHAEHLLTRVARQSDCRLGIVRLGNIIGPGAPTWIAGIAQRVLEGKPVSFGGEKGFLNATHVENAADYLVSLVEIPEGDLTAHGPFHHLAEYSSRSWVELFEVMSRVSGNEWQCHSRSQPETDIRSALMRGAKTLYKGKLGGYARAVLSSLPQSSTIDRMAVSAQSLSSPTTSRSEVDPQILSLLTVLSCPREFRSHTIPGWQPQIGFEQATVEIEAWLSESGYRLSESLV